MHPFCGAGAVMYWDLAVYLISLICLVWGSGFVVSKLLPPNPHRDGLPNGGQRIGYLERLLIFIFVMVGSYEAIGFLVTAKSILRFGESRKDRKYAEYVLLGTLASILCATVIGVAAKYALARLALCSS